VYCNRLQRDNAGHRGTGPKTTACLELEKLEYDLHLRVMVGNAQAGRHGLGMPAGSKVRWNRAPSNVVARLQLSELIKQRDQERVEAAKQRYEMQNAWLRWMDMRMKGDLTWNKILYRYSENLLQFVLKAQLNVLPSLDNLNRWKIPSSGTCSLCGSPFPTLVHVLACCSVVLTEEECTGALENRYKWRHNCVLRTLAQAIRRKLAFVNSLPANVNAADSLQRPVTFTKAGSADGNSRPVKEHSRCQTVNLGVLLRLAIGRATSTCPSFIVRRALPMVSLRMWVRQRTVLTPSLCRGRLESLLRDLSLPYQ